MIWIFRLQQIKVKMSKMLKSQWDTHTCCTRPRVLYKNVISFCVQSKHTQTWDLLFIIVSRSCLTMQRLCDLVCSQWGWEVERSEIAANRSISKIRDRSLLSEPLSCFLIWLLQLAISVITDTDVLAVSTPSTNYAGLHNAECCQQFIFTSELIWNIKQSAGHRVQPIFITFLVNNAGFRT